MAISKTDVVSFLKYAERVPVLDVRSPKEFSHAHIPGALSFPLFTDEERHIIGTSYKQESREQAIKIGLEAFGKKMRGMVEKVEQIIEAGKFERKELCIHCWRGGMRSGAVAWLMDLYGFKVHLLTGGYKAYRKHVLAQFDKTYPLVILGGYTGGNKTGVINQLEVEGETVIDLEKLAGHKGSAFGNLDQVPQPGQEQFENDLAMALENAMQTNPSRLWLEGESQRIGHVNLPYQFYLHMRASKQFLMDIPFRSRLKFIVEGYGRYPKESLINGIMRIQKRLGGLETKTAISYLMEDDIENCFAILLKYYDRHYMKSFKKKEYGERQEITVKCEGTDEFENTKQLLKHAGT